MPQSVNHAVIFCCAVKTGGIVLVIVSGFKDVGWFGSVGVSFVGYVGPREKWSSHLAGRDTLPEMLPKARVGADIGHAWACPHRNSLSVTSQGGMGCENFSSLRR
jgi:hypothetical protein